MPKMGALKGPFKMSPKVGMKYTSGQKMPGKGTKKK